MTIRECQDRALFSMTSHGATNIHEAGFTRLS